MKRAITIIVLLLIFAGTAIYAQDKLHLTQRTEEYGVFTVILSNGTKYSRDFDPDLDREEAVSVRSWKVGDTIEIDTDTQHNGCGSLKLTNTDQNPPTHACFPKPK